MRKLFPNGIYILVQGRWGRRVVFLSEFFKTWDALKRKKTKKKKKAKSRNL